MLTIDEIRKSISQLGSEYGIKRIYLFGSYARGEATEDSDIDLRIDRGNLSNLIELIEFTDACEAKLGKRVDVLTTRSLSQRFLARIKPDEVLIYG